MIVEKKVSAVDKVTKYLYKSDKYKPFLLEYTYVDNGSGKDIICMPSFSSCSLGCKFCHLTQRKSKKSVAVEVDDNLAAIKYILKDQGIGSIQKAGEGNQTLLLSFMGAGEPTLNSDVLIETAKQVRRRYSLFYDKVRFALSTIIPVPRHLDYISSEFLSNGLDLKIHYSLHLWDNETKRNLMPLALPTDKALVLLKDLSKFHPIEVHYTPFSSNSGIEDILKLKDLVETTNFNVKILNFSERPDHLITPKISSKDFYNNCISEGIPSSRIEYYCPPGHDVNGCCGEFELDFSKYWD